MTKQILGSAPLFCVKNLEKSLSYYCDVLGFHRPFLLGDPPSFAMPELDGMIVMLSEQTNGLKTRQQATFCDAYFWVRDVKTLYEEFSGRKATMVQSLIHKEAYNNLEFIIKDPDGYLLAFGQELYDNTLPLFGTEFIQLNPVFASQDVARDVIWYEEKLGFKKIFDSGDSPLNYAGLIRQELSIHLQFQFPKDMTSTDLRIEVKNLEPLYHEYCRTGVIKSDALRLKTAWGTNEFGLYDLNGNRIHFYEDL